jgi:sporulation protein YlmC with PRC-barrel domain
MRIPLGSKARSQDGTACEIADLVLEASGLRVTHLVVQPPEPAPARLVPADLASEGGDGLTLGLTIEAFEQLETVHEFAYLQPGESPDVGPDSTIGVEDAYANPTAGTSALGDSLGDLTAGVGLAYDRIPKGEVELRHQSSVFTGDGHHLGRVEGVVLDDGRKITQLLLERGHLWWKREIVIPASVVAKIENDIVSLSATKREVEALPSTSL